MSCSSIYKGKHFNVKIIKECSLNLDFHQIVKEYKSHLEECQILSDIILAGCHYTVV